MINLDTFCKIESYKDIFGEYFTEGIISRIENGDDVILETLNSHDTDLLIKKLKKLYPNAEFARFNRELNKTGFFMDIDNADKLKDDEKLINILNFYGYYITCCKTNTIIIEPTFSDNITHKLYNNNGVCYYFTDNKSAESILKNGLRCKEGSSYRDFPARIYLYIPKQRFLSIHNGKPSPDLYNFISRVVSNNKIKLYGLAILKIDLNRADINVYKDTLMYEEGACFTYNNIPAKLIKKLDINIKI